MAKALSPVPNATSGPAEPEAAKDLSASTAADTGGKATPIDLESTTSAAVEEGKPSDLESSTPDAGARGGPSDVESMTSAAVEEAKPSEAQPVLEATVTGEELVTDLDELYYRQCAEGNFDKVKMEPTEQIFRCRTEDRGKLSGGRSKKVTAQAAYEHRTKVLELKSRGVWAVSVAEVQHLDSQVIDDSALLTGPPPPPPGHSYIDQRHLHDADDRQFFRQELLAFALERARQWPLGMA